MRFQDDSRGVSGPWGGLDWKYSKKITGYQYRLPLLQTQLLKVESDSDGVPNVNPRGDLVCRWSDARASELRRKPIDHTALSHLPLPSSAVETK